MSRHHCYICKRRRDEKFMIHVPFEVTSSLGLPSTYLCEREINWHRRSSCLSEFKNQKLKKLQESIQKIQSL